MTETNQLLEQEPDLKNLAKARITEGELLLRGANYVMPSKIGECQPGPRLEVAAAQRAQAKKEMDVDNLYELLRKAFTDEEIGVIQKTLGNKMLEEERTNKGQATDFSRVLKAILNRFDPNIFEVPK